MKKILPILFLSFLSAKSFAQRFSQYNTGTLYDSFENPSQKVFTSDTSKMFAFNFLAPNLNFNFFLTGDVQSALKSRAFSNYYNTAALQIGKGRYNQLNANANAYLVMFKVFSDVSGEQELGFSINTKAEARGLVSDESVALFNGTGSFPNSSYNNIFNDNFYYQVYQQIGFTYRETISKKFALGVKLSALSGVTYDRIEITQSQITLDTVNDAASLALIGKNNASSNEGKSYLQNMIPTFRNPGASISIGGSYKSEDGFTIQGNIKDLGFIHWNKHSSTYFFNNIGSPITIGGLSTPSREDSIYNKVHALTTTSPSINSFTTATNGLAELSVNKSFWLDYDRNFNFSPTIIAQKELLYSGFTAALVAPFRYHKYSITLTTSYNDLKLVNFGGQFMIKSDDFEFFIGSERLYQSASLIKSAVSQASAPVEYYTAPTPFTGADFFIGLSWKFGPVVEHNMNSSGVAVNSEKGFLGRLFERIFPQDAIKNN
ncbi:MAG: DUF5723 family protein [Mucilaginibacter sp.]